MSIIVSHCTYHRMMRVNNKPSKPTVIDLFSGCGGMSWGFKKNGFEVLAGIDEWGMALETFKHNHPESKVYLSDIRNLDPSDVMKDLAISPGDLDVLVGGPPCQGFSKNQTAQVRFIDDPRNQLFKDFMHYVKVMRPKIVLMENVAEIYNAFDGRVRQEIIELFYDLNYTLNIKILNAAEFGVPQKRRRCFFLATQNKERVDFPMPTHVLKKDDLTDLFNGELESFTSAWSAISDLPEPVELSISKVTRYKSKPQNSFQQWVRQDCESTTNHQKHKLSEIQQKRYDSLLPGQDIRHLPPEIKPKSGYSGAYGRLDLTCLAPTITRWVFHPGSGRYGHPRDSRILTMRESARLQSFTDDFEFIGSRTEIAGQIGNAVPPKLAFEISKQIKKNL